MSKRKNAGDIFPDILSDLIMDSEKKLREIARESGIGVSQLSAYQSGKNEPNMSTLVKLSDYFNVSIDYLVGNSNDITLETQIGYTREITGLTKAAIQKLNNVNREHPEYSSVVSVMLEDFNFEYIVCLLYNRFMYSAPEYNVQPVTKLEDGEWHLINAREFHKSLDASETKIQFDNLHLVAKKETLLDSMITTSLIADMKQMAKVYLERQKKKASKKRRDE